MIQLNQLSTFRIFKSNINLIHLIELYKFDYKQICIIPQFRWVKYLRDDIGIKRFGKKLREVRLSKNLSQEALAWEANIEPMQVSRIERGVIDTGISQILNLAKALKIKPGELFDWE